MRVVVSRRNSPAHYERLLTDPQAVKRFLLRANEAWFDWFEPSTAEPHNDHPLIREMLGDRTGFTLWKFRTADGVDGLLFIGLALQDDLIQVNCWLGEPPEDTGFRLLKPILDGKLERLGIEIPKTLKRTEYLQELEDRTRTSGSS